MSIFDIDGWTYTPEPRKGRVVFTKPGQTDIWVRHNGFWQYGQQNVHPSHGLLPQQATVERTMRRKTLPHQLKGWGNNTDGGLQGEMVYLDLHDVPRDFAWLDGVTERHSVSATHTNTGEPLTRENGLGFHYGYNPLRNDAYTQYPQKLYPFVSYPEGHECASWQRKDPAHLGASYFAAVACLPDPVALMRLVEIANDVLVSRVLAYNADGSLMTNLGDGSLTLGGNLTNARGGSRGSAYSGEVRARAWELGAVTQAYKAVAPEFKERFAAWMRAQIEFVHMIQADSGAFTRDGGDHNAYSGHPWIDTGDGYAPLPQDWECETVWEACFLTQTLYDAALALGEREPLERVKMICEKRKRLLGNLPEVPGEWGGVGPWKYLVVAKSGQLVQTITEGKGKGLNSYNGYAYRVFSNIGVAA